MQPRPPSAEDALGSLEAVTAARALDLTPPTGREELWRHADLAAYRGEGLARPQPWRTDVDLPAPAAAWLAGLEPAGGPSLVRVDGEPLPGTAEGVEVGGGVQVLGLRVAARLLPSLLATHLGSLVGPEDAFAADALAEVQDGAVIHVPPGVTAAAPVRVALGLATPGVAVRTRTVVVVGAGGELALEEVLGGPDLGAASRVSHVTEIFLGPGARMTWLGWQALGAGARLLRHGRARLEAGATLRTLHAAWGASRARTVLGVDLTGPGAEAELSGVHLAGADQQLEHLTEQRHGAAHTRSDLLFHGAVAGDGHAVYTGTIHVAPGARRTDAYQASRNLLLSTAARADVSPRLEIETDDVRCTHGASVGRLDDAQRFYLMSRGLDRRAAERLLVSAFLAQAAGRLPWPGLEARVEATLSGRLEGVP